MTLPNGPFIGKGMTFSTSATSTFTTPFAKVLNATPPGPKIADVETTGYDSLIEDMIPGFENAGEAEIEINYDATQTSTLYALLGVSMQYWKLQYPDGSSGSTGSTYVFQGYINSFAGETPCKGQLKNKIKIRVQTKPVYTIAT